jgi:diacylglycerol kinase family enzyme
LVINPGAGSELGQTALEELRRRLPRARIVEVGEGEDLDALVRDAAETCEVLGIFGGDGSALKAAEAALAAGKPLLLLPGGTLNHLARDLGIDSADDALDALERGQAVEVELAAIDGRPFLNSASFGATTRMIDGRERLERKLSRWPAQAAALLGVLRRARPQSMLIDGKQRNLWMAFIGNCRHKPEGFAPSWRPRLDDGLLDIRLIEADGRWSRLRVALAVLTGRLSRCRAYDHWEAPGGELARRPDAAGTRREHLRRQPQLAGREAAAAARRLHPCPLGLRPLRSNRLRSASGELERYRLAPAPAAHSWTRGARRRLRRPHHASVPQQALKGEVASPNRAVR